MQLPTLKVALADGLEARIHSTPATGTAIQAGFNQRASNIVAFGLGSYTFITPDPQRDGLFKYRNSIKSEDSLMPFTLSLSDIDSLTVTKGKWSSAVDCAFILAIIRIADKTNVATFSATPEIDRGYCTLLPDTRLLVILDDDVQLITAEEFFYRMDIKILNIHEYIATIILDHLDDLNRLTFEYGVGFRYDCTGIERLNLGTSPDICVTEYYNCDSIMELRQQHYINITRHIDLSNSPMTRVPAYIFAHSQLERIDLPKGITELSALTFLRCRELKYIDLPEGLKYLDIGAFQESGLQLLVIPKSVTHINMSRLCIPDLMTLAILGSGITWSYDSSILTPKNKIVFLTCDIFDLLRLDNMVHGLFNLMPNLKYINNKPVDYYQSSDFKASLILHGCGDFIWHSAG